MKSRHGLREGSGGAFVAYGVRPAEYDDAILFGDFVCDKIFKLTPKGGGGYEGMSFATGSEAGAPSP